MARERGGQPLRRRRGRCAGWGEVDLTRSGTWAVGHQGPESEVRDCVPRQRWRLRKLFPISFPFPRLLSVISLVSYLRRKGNCRISPFPSHALFRSVSSPVRCWAVIPAICPLQPSRPLASRAQPRGHRCELSGPLPSATCLLTLAPRCFSPCLPLYRAPPLRA